MDDDDILVAATIKAEQKTPTPNEDTFHLDPMEFPNETAKGI